MLRRMIRILLLWRDFGRRGLRLSGEAVGDFARGSILPVRGGGTPAVHYGGGRRRYFMARLGLIGMLGVGRARFLGLLGLPGLLGLRLLLRRLWLCCRECRLGLSGLGGGRPS